MKKENQRVMITKQMLKNGFLNIIQHKNIDKISILEICNESGINRSTFYRHYQEPKDILIEIEKDLFNEVKLKIKIPETANDLKKSLENICVFLEEHASILKILIQNSSDDTIMRIYDEIYIQIYPEIVHLPIFKGWNEESMKILFLHFAGGNYFIMRSWLLGKIKKTPNQIADLIYNIIMNTNLKENILLKNN
ncbi:MAG: TetR/AcrR family transcriptional regulator [Traorella sp.]